MALPPRPAIAEVHLEGNLSPNNCTARVLVFFAAVNVLARVLMKDVANCVKRCDLRNSVNQWRVESMRYPHIHVEVSLDRCIVSAQLL